MVLVELIVWDRVMEVGNTGNYIYLQIEPDALALLAKNDLVRQEKWSKSSTEGPVLRPYDRVPKEIIEEIRETALKLHPIGGTSVKISTTQLQEAIDTGKRKYQENQEEEEKEKAERAELIRKRQEEVAAKEEAIQKARDLLKDELSSKDKQIKELLEERDRHKRTQQENEEAICRKLASNGAFDIVEEVTVTYKVMKEGDDC